MRVRVEQAMAVLAASLLFVASGRWIAAGPSVERSIAPQRTVTPRRMLPLPGGLDSLADATIDADPFRLSNEAPSVRYTNGGSSPQGAAAPPARPKPARPQLVLRGVLGGPPWTAIIDGLPGANAPTVVRVGDRASGLTVREIRFSAVVVAGTDTTWRLLLSRP